MQLFKPCPITCKASLFALMMLSITLILPKGNPGEWHHLDQLLEGGQQRAQLLFLIYSAYSTTRKSIPGLLLVAMSLYNILCLPASLNGLAGGVLSEILRPISLVHIEANSTNVSLYDEMTFLRNLPSARPLKMLCHILAVSD